MSSKIASLSVGTGGPRGAALALASEIIPGAKGTESVSGKHVKETEISLLVESAEVSYLTSEENKTVKIN